MKTFDLAVIGTGTATSAVDVCSREGWKVAVIDDRAYGGTCALRGCNPKKVLVDAAGVVDLVRRTTGTLIEGEPRIDWRHSMEFKRSFTEPVAPGRSRSIGSLVLLNIMGERTLSHHMRFRLEKRFWRQRKFCLPMVHRR